MTLPQLSRRSTGPPLASCWRSQRGLEHTPLRSPVLSGLFLSVLFHAVLMQRDMQRGSWVYHDAWKQVIHRVQLRMTS